MKKHSIPHIKLTLYMPIDLMAQIDIYHYDPLTKKPRMGARGALIQQLLWEWLAEQRRDSVRIPAEQVEEAE